MSLLLDFTVLKPLKPAIPWCIHSIFSLEQLHSLTVLKPLKPLAGLYHTDLTFERDGPVLRAWSGGNRIPYRTCSTLIYIIFRFS